MANIDCTLNAIKAAGFSGYTPPFGTKVTGSVTPRDAQNNVLMPFGFQRPKVVTETGTTTEIQANIVFEIVAGGIDLTLGDAAFTGCRVAVINSANTEATVKFAASPSVSIAARAHESVHFEWVNGTWTIVNDRSEFINMIDQALDLGDRAHQEIEKTLNQRIQSGIATITNRGVISGLTVIKSTTALRNISLDAGKFFMNGMPYVCPAYPNSALVPDNYSTDTQYCYAYIYFDDQDGVTKFACTPLGGSVPENGMPLYRFAVPAGNSYQNDPYLNSVTMTDVRRIEAAYPVKFDSTAYASVALPFNMLDAEYGVQLEVIDYKGGANPLMTIRVGSKAANGFNIYSESTLDVVRVRWTALKQQL
ncbi:MAG: hypothetical protein LBQ88_17365 [Treponema sp.]|jgi:hypothetical protein|nr:hypothetical protein [Treponema sp.]